MIGRAILRSVIAGLLALTFPQRPLPAQHVEDLDTLRARAGFPVAAVRAASVGFSDAGWASRAESAITTRTAVTGTLTVLLIPALFSDSDEPQSAPGFLQQLFFDGPSPTGTLREFFAEASGGVLQAAGAAAPWSRTSVSTDSATGGPSSVFGVGSGFGAYLLEALAAADQALDFAQFDNDGPDGVPNSGDDNGVVDAVTFLFREAARSCGGPGVWPHKSGVSGYNGGQPWASNDSGAAGSPIVVDGYVIISASECDGSPLRTVGIVAHELGHELRLPDLYHPIGSGISAILSVNRRWVVGCFGLMAGGAWGCGPADQFPSFGPTHFSAWSRDQLGWIDRRIVGDVVLQEFVLEPVQTSLQVLEVPLDRDSVESLLIEYRPQFGFDGELPASGIVIYRYNRAGALRPDPAGPPRYLISVLEADGDSTLVRTHGEGGNRGEASDMFVTDGTTVVLSNVTTPSTRLADGEPSTVTIHSIEVSGGVARLVISTVDTPVVVVTGVVGPAEALVPLRVEFPVSGGAQPYGATIAPGTAPDGVTVSVTADLLTFEGAPAATGPFDVEVRVADARGVAGVTIIPLTVFPLVIPTAELLMALFDDLPGQLTAAQRAVLDNDGNRNGFVDVGDVRRYLTRTDPLPD